MADFYRLQESLTDVSREYFAMTQAASDCRAREFDAAVRIQSVYSASKVRSRYHAILTATRLIQRIARGHLARERTTSMRIGKTRRLNALFFHHCAAVIQKFFRGFWSRKTLHDYYGRKAYLAEVGRRSEYTNAYLQREHAQKVHESKLNEERTMRKEFDNLAGELHHLVSTRTIPGIYNPPYNDALPRAFEKPIEQHLRDSCRVQIPLALKRPKLRPIVASASPRSAPLLSPAWNSESGGHHTESTRGPGGGHRSGPPQDLPSRGPLSRSRSANAGRLQKIQGPFRSKEQIEVSNAKARVMYKSVQATAPYDICEKDAKMQARLAKLTRVSPNDFNAPGLPPQNLAPSSVHASVPYKDRPFELRGDYTELPKIRDKPPFFTSMPHDKQFEEYRDGPLLSGGAV